ncbi:MAG: glycosyltransferase family 4 protein [Lentisphaeria bacterium]|nr:glycosyltransferase family 4 protein [Lentisphaeria bacterium]
MRILMVNKYLYPRAGAETYMLYISKVLVNHGHEVAFFGMEHQENTKIGKCYSFPFLNFGKSQGDVRRGLNIAKALKQKLTREVERRFDNCVSEFKPDIIHAHNIYNQISPGLFIKHINNYPIVKTVHDYKPICPNYSLFVDGKTCTRCLVKPGNYSACTKLKCCQSSKIISYLASKSAAYHFKNKTYQRGYHHFISPSKFLKDKLIQGGFDKNKISVINNFSEYPSSVALPSKGFFYAGRLCKEKGVDTILDAYHRIPHPKPPLRIAGEGPIKNYLMEMASKKNDTVTWLGRISPNEVLKELEKSAISIISSRWFENCSMSIMESLSNGRPCIVSDSGGNPELISHEETGWVYQAGDVDDLKKTMEVCIKKTPKELTKMSQEARKSALERFSPDVHLEKLLKIYQLVQKELGKSLI